MIRLAVSRDIPAIISLTRAAYAPYLAQLGAAPVPVTEDYAPRVAAGQVWLLEQDAALAGLIVLERRADHILIFSVAVAPSHQGKGHGIRLLAWAEEKAREAGLQEVRLYTNAKMERNVALYSSYGYRETGRRPHPVRQGSVVVDMAKALKAPHEPVGRGDVAGT